MNSTSNHTWKPGQCPPLRITAAGIRALAYFDYVNAHEIVSLNPTDTARPPDEQPPQDPGDQEWDSFPKAHIQTPDETAWVFQQLLDAGATFPNFQTPDPSPEDRDTEDPIYDDDFDLSEGDDALCHECGAVLDAFSLCPFCDHEEEF